ncbi:MAG TPA: carboxypeptidase-like regulatory domain-containing protein, partial [Acidobacteriaceae bacterium]|nr:carboxypeptidase-like regulatory domain-containing protein [Acidobacteriaceae bacterium]
MRSNAMFAGRIRMAWTVKYIFLLLLLISTGNYFLWAQAIAGGQIQGTVTDETGSAVSGATVEVVQTESGLQRTVTSSADGGYNLPSLPVGPYTLKVTASGFSTYNQSGIVIEVGNELRIDVKLQVGGVSQTVQVQAAASMVQTEDQSLSQVIDRQRTVDLPLNGRQATQLILLTPGTANAPTTDLASSKNYPSAVTLSVAGAQATNINYLMDGADNNDAFTNVNLPFPFPDAIQEFSVQTSGLSAQYGVHPGAVVNIVTRAGGNSFHGTLFEFLRNGDFNAKNHFSTKQDTLKRNQFGGVLGGPIRKDKLFFFGGYQGTRTRQETNAYTSYVPTAQMLTGDFSAYAGASCQSGGVTKQLINPATGAAYPNNQIPTSQFNSSALALINNYIPQASNPCGKLVYGLPLPQNEDQFIGRIDWTATAKQTVFGRYYLTHFTQPGIFDNNLLNTQNPILDDRVQSFTLGHTYTLTSALVSSFHLGWTRNIVSRNVAPDSINPNTIGIQNFSPIKNYIYMNISNAFTVACGTCESLLNSTNGYNVLEDMFWTKGKNHISFGGEYLRNMLVSDGVNNANGQFNFTGQYTKDGLVDFMLGKIQSLYQGNNSGVDVRKNYGALYFQDSIQFSPRLTVNAGLRWATGLPGIETTGRGASFSLADFTSGTKSVVYPTAPPGVLFYGDPGIPKGYYHGKWNRLEPRIGVAFDPRGEGKESIRASYSLGFQEPPLYYNSRYAAMPPWGDSVTLTPPPGNLTTPYAGYPGGNPYPKPFPPTAENAFFPTSGTFFVLPTNLQQAYTQNWNLSVQKQFLKDWALTTTYLGTRVLHNSYGNEQNPAVYYAGKSTGAVGSCGALVTVPAAGQPCSSTGNTNARRVLTNINPTQGAYFTQVTQAYTGLGASFNGLLVTVQHRFSDHFTLLTNYTYSHCLSGPPENGDNAGDQFQDPAHPNRDYSNCGSDLRHNFVTSAIIRSTAKGTYLRQLWLGGWQLAPIITATTGVPFTVTTGTDASLTGVGNDRPNLIGSPRAQNTKITTWLNRASFAANTAGTYGTTRPF